MAKQKIILFICMGLLTSILVKAELWTTHFAYNNVTQIAMTPDKVYAISDGSLYSVDKMTEQMDTYNRLSGLHSTGITCIHYDEVGKQLFVCYGTGKIDLLSENGVRYLSELYDKDMTQQKTIYNVTIQGRLAYLSTHYGVQTMDLRENKLVDSYWLRPNGQETPVKDVLIQGDSIYAFTDDSLYCAALLDNLVDYTFWKREIRSGRVSPDPDKGTHYKDATSEWYAGQKEGIIRFTATERLTYKPQGPLFNTPYRLIAEKGRLWMFQGGRWDSQYNREGVVMIFDGSHWTNISAETIEAKTGNPALDFMNVAVDPRDKNHYFITSYGTGLYEFDHDTLVRQYLPDENNTLSSAAASNPTRYTRLDYLDYDHENNLWILVGGGNPTYHLACIDADTGWHGISAVYNSERIKLNTTGGFLIDKLHQNLKWFGTARHNTCWCLIDDHGTPFDDSDDRVIRREEWTNQNGQSFKPQFIYTAIQDDEGRIWIGTEMGAAYIDRNTDYFASDAIVQPNVRDDNGENPLTSLTINAICQTKNGNVWIGTSTLGVYVLNSAATEIVAHYTTENSAMPANGILSLACDENDIVYIGTAEGLVSYDPNSSPEGLNIGKNNDDNLLLGSMQQWRLHLSYSNATEVVATPRRIFALANGSLFSYNREDGELEYWSRATGLNGNAIAHIIYDASSGCLIIAYEDGRIDLINDDGDIKQMPDIYMKAGSIAVTANSLYVGSKYTYLAMPFGIIAIEPRKGIVKDTYYIGPNASSVDVRCVVEMRDSLYAFAADHIYSAALKDNLQDYRFWHKSDLTTNSLKDAAVHNTVLYTLQHDSLYRREGNNWHLVLQQPVSWMHESGGQLLLYIEGQGLFRLRDDEKLSGLSNSYALNDAIYTQGEYWLGERNWGLIRLNSVGDEYYHTSGPNSNFGYCLHAAHGQIYSAIGGRWATEYIRHAKLNIYDGWNWRAYDAGHFSSKLGVLALDPVSIAVDENDASHFFVATYGTGVFEFRNYEVVKQYTTGNSTLQPVNSTINPLYYTRTDGVMLDKEGNLWVQNATKIGKPVHVMTPSGQWYGLQLKSGSENITFTTPSGIWIDRRDSKIKWMFDQRHSQGVIALNDGGTPTYNGDDKCMKRSSFIDQNGNTLAPSTFQSFAQDHSGRIWIGTEKGIIIIPASVNFFSSNECHRIIIPRNDETNLGDYLLGDEQINCLAVDGGNRMWIGTANSGLYLIEDDTITVAHFTETNSLLPSNSIQSIAINPTTGEVFVGTDRGIASYRSDASEAQKNMSNAYAYPNPVRPDYGGIISIAGLMENTVVNIVDAGGNLVCKTKSHGGTAVWDGKLPDGRRATPGVYTALCNADGGHTVVKILVVR